MYRKACAVRRTSILHQLCLFKTNFICGFLFVNETNQRVTNNANKAGAGDGGGSLRDIMIHRHSQAVKQRRRAVKREKELYKIRANTHTFGDHNVFFC